MAGVSGAFNGVTATGWPPDAGTRNNGLAADGVNRIVPSSFQSPPRPFAALASVCGAPPATSILFKLPSAKKPIERPSGDQNGNAPPSVPSSGCGTADASERTDSRETPSTDATKATVLPRETPRTMRDHSSKGSSGPVWFPGSWSACAGTQRQSRRVRRQRTTQCAMRACVTVGWAALTSRAR